jgi:predicted nucleic acid-binding protein
MKDRIFLDTNVIVYAHTDIDLVKQKTAQAFIVKQSSVISTQVLQETANTLSKKFLHSWMDINKVLAELSQNNVVTINNENTIFIAARMAERYRFAFYDCLIIAAGLESGCSILYSEDLNHLQKIEDSLLIVNPFL